MPLFRNSSNGQSHGICRQQQTERIRPDQIARGLCQARQLTAWVVCPANSEMKWPSIDRPMEKVVHPAATGCSCPPRTKTRAYRKSQVRQCLVFCSADFIGKGGPKISWTKTQTLPNLRLPISSANNAKIRNGRYKNFAPSSVRSPKRSVAHCVVNLRFVQMMMMIGWHAGLVG